MRDHKQVKWAGRWARGGLALFSAAILLALAVGLGHQSGYPNTVALRSESSASLKVESIERPSAFEVAEGASTAASPDQSHPDVDEIRGEILALRRAARPTRGETAGALLEDSSAPTPAPSSAQRPSGCLTLMCRLLRQLGDLSSLPLRTETTLTQVSSQDRVYLEHYWDYFNSDQLFRSRGFEIRTGYDGRKEYVVLRRTDGPGYIPRMWFTHRQHNWALQDGDDPTSEMATEWGFFAEAGNLRIYFDDEPTPRIDMPLTELFSGNAWPFMAPLVGHYGTANGGNISYLPLPFYGSVLVATTGLPRLFEIEVVRFTPVPEQPFESFRMGLTAAEAQELRQVIQTWNNRGGYPYRNSSGLSALERSLSIEPFSSAEITLPGPGLISALKIYLPPGMDERIGMKIYWDGQPSPSVQGPLRALFGAAEATRRYRSLPLGISFLGEVNEFYNYFPMPFNSQARIVFENGRADPALLEVSLGYRSTAFDPSLAHFHAQFKVERLHARSDDGGNYLLADLSGSGRYVGCILTMYDVDRNTQPALDPIWRFPYLESDVNIWVDGVYALPGTGIEDDFDAGYYYIYTDVPGRQWAFALAGNTWKDERSWGEVISQYRFYLTNKVEFRRSLRVEVEHGFIGNNLSVTYSSTAFWYGDA